MRLGASQSREPQIELILVQKIEKCTGGGERAGWEREERRKEEWTDWGETYFQKRRRCLAYSQHLKK